MKQEGMNQNDLKDMITRRAYFFVALWAAGILFLYGVGGYLGVRALHGYKVETEKFRQAAIQAVTTEPGSLSPEIKMPTGAKPVEVLVGMYINSIGEFSLKEAGWPGKPIRGQMGRGEAVAALTDTELPALRGEAM